MTIVNLMLRKKKVIIFVLIIALLGSFVAGYLQKQENHKAVERLEELCKSRYGIDNYVIGVCDRGFCCLPKNEIELNQLGYNLVKSECPDDLAFTGFDSNGSMICKKNIVEGTIEKHNVTITR